MNSIADYAIVMLNPQGKIAEWNVGAYNIYGYESNEVINCHFSLFYQPEAIEKTHPERELSNALLTGRHQEEGLRIRKDGSTFWAYSIITPIYDNEKKLVGFAKITRDLSEQKRMEEKMKTVLIELKRSNEDLSNFAYVASHDLKAPLRAIESLSAWIEQDKLNRLTPESKENLHMLHQRTQRMSNLIDGILQYARADQMDKATSLVNLRELLDEVILSLDLPSAFQIHYPDNLPIFETSKIRLSQVFSNLIDNGIKYHDRKEGRIDIGFKDAGRFYEFSVTDDGPGIDPAYHDRIFEIFQTLQSRDTIESTGIGLSIVKKIIEVQGGYIRILSTAGKGATFQFTWPKRPDL
jgi:PAS domain S-box-containing protein